jgi:hypothetical protein
MCITKLVAAVFDLLATTNCRLTSLTTTFKLLATIKAKFHVVLLNLLLLLQCFSQSFNLVCTLYKSTRTIGLQCLHSAFKMTKISYIFFFFKKKNV